MNAPSTIFSPAEFTLNICRYTAAFICASGVLSILIIHIVRNYSSASGAFSLALGVGPNFMAALCMPVAVPALVNQLLRGSLPRLSPQRWALVCFVVTQVVFVVWEFFQLVVDTMFFDVKDVGATALGGVIWLVLAKSLSRDTYIGI